MTVYVLVLHTGYDMLDNKLIIFVLGLEGWLIFFTNELSYETGYY